MPLANTKKKVKAQKKIFDRDVIIKGRGVTTALPIFSSNHIQKLFLIEDGARDINNFTIFENAHTQTMQISSTTIFI